VRIPTDLPPNIPEEYPYDTWVQVLEIGVAKHMFQWRSERVSDDQIIILALQMIDVTCKKASYVHQQWLEIEFGKDWGNMCNLLLRRSVQAAHHCANIDLSTLSPPKPRDYGIGNSPEQMATRPMTRVQTERRTD
jgi:hypothetical protein